MEELPELDGRLDVLELGAPGQQGKLDPLRIGLEELREELAYWYLLELLVTRAVVGERDGPRREGRRPSR